MARRQRSPPTTITPISAAIVSVKRNACRTWSISRAKPTAARVEDQPREPAGHQEGPVAGGRVEIFLVDIAGKEGPGIDHQVRAGRHVGRHHAGDHQADPAGPQQSQAGVAEGVFPVLEVSLLLHDQGGDDQPGKGPADGAEPLDHGAIGLADAAGPLVRPVAFMVTMCGWAVMPTSPLSVSMRMVKASMPLASL